MILKPKGHGNTAAYSIEELSAMIDESKENIWQFLSDLSKRDSIRSASINPKRGAKTAFYSSKAIFTT